MPKNYEWDCGDDSPVENTSEPTLSHAYKKPAPGTSVTHDVTVKTSGPSDCEDSAKTKVTITVPPVIVEPCPKITNLTCVEDKSKPGTFTFTVSVAGERKPDRYEWDFGDGHKDPTGGTTVSHTYQMPAAGKTSTHTVTVTAIGPDNCKDSADKPVKLTTPTNGHPCPPVCNYLQLIAGFFLALTFCAILFVCVDDTQRTEDDGVLIPMIFVFGILALGCIFFWFKKGCPIGKKELMGLFAIVFLTLFVVGMFTIGCVSMVISILALILAGFCFFMYRKCGATAMDLILAGVVCFLAFCVAGLWLASRVLDCC